jgi:hypothetical protein
MIAFVSHTEAGTDVSRESDVENDESDQNAQPAGPKQEDSGSDVDSEPGVAENNQVDDTAPDLPDDADGGQDGGDVIGDEQPIQEEGVEEAEQQQVVPEQREHPLPPAPEYNLNIRDQV